MTSLSKRRITFYNENSIIFSEELRIKRIRGDRTECTLLIQFYMKMPQRKILGWLDMTRENEKR